MQAIQTYNNNTPVRWTAAHQPSQLRQLTTEPADTSGCGLSDGIGVLGGLQHISISTDPICADLGTFIHEMGHALGLEPEQTRSDRDYYINALSAVHNRPVEGTMEWGVFRH